MTVVTRPSRYFFSPITVISPIERRNLDERISPIPEFYSFSAPLPISPLNETCRAHIVSSLSVFDHPSVIVSWHIVHTQPSLRRRNIHNFPFSSRPSRYMNSSPIPRTSWSLILVSVTISVLSPQFVILKTDFSIL
jgi:hypothetical protein